MNINSAQSAYTNPMYQPAQKTGGQTIQQAQQPPQQVQQPQQAQPQPSEERQESMLTQSLEGPQGEQTETQTRTINTYA
nr:hypothetical protein [uncultured Desulfobulbus sp.]